ncbi:hypothetical protein BW733_05860 [Tessaracoccus flavescens]|uniref:Uncharacterized protein n=1 Tax=Tessaracoccus flavescens TaxID=399497 RepID=A0A1Q2CWE0_9ACTN|nr:hypothetical protein BW733_05860 [Tessaracoccus flavescens]
MSGIVKHFPSAKALDGVDLEVFPGEVHCLLTHTTSPATREDSRHAPERRRQPRRGQAQAVLQTPRPRSGASPEKERTHDVTRRRLRYSDPDTPEPAQARHDPHRRAGYADRQRDQNDQGTHWPAPPKTHLPGRARARPNCRRTGRHGQQPQGTGQVRRLHRMARLAVRHVLPTRNPPRGTQHQHRPARRIQGTLRGVLLSDW